MTSVLKLVLTVLAVFGSISTGYVFYNGHLSPDDWIYQGRDQWKDGGVHGAPGPILGAGIPVAALVGYGAYWLARRRRSQ